MESESEVSEEYSFNDGIKRKGKNNNTSSSKRHKLNNTKNTEDPLNANRELYKPPTVEELNQLRETEVLFNSNLFRLQTEELLKEVSVKQKRKKEIDEWIEQLEEFVDKIPECDLNILQKTKSKNKNIAKEILENTPLTLKMDQEINFRLSKPLSLRTVGLYNINAAVGSVISININVAVPKSIFNEKDYLNSRYLVKRSLYLSYLAVYMKKADFITHCFYTYLNGNALIPVLKVTPKEVKNCTFYILVTPEDNTFKLSRFDPDKSNIRCAYFNTISQQNLIQFENLNTPFYNSIILHDLTLSSNDQFQENLIREKKGAWEGLVLLEVWLQQRELCDGFGGFNEDLMYAVVTYLIYMNKINKHMSSYQVIRNVWNYLATSTWDTNGTVINDNKSKLTLFHENHEVVFIDKSGHYNLAFDLDLNVYLKIKQEANLALTYLDEGKFNSFQALFMTKMNFYLQYDTILSIFDNPELDNIYNTIEDRIKLDHLNFKQALLTKTILSLIKTGLSDRIECIVPKLKTNICWKVEEKPLNNDVSFAFGIKLNFTNIFRIVDKGPPAYDPLAAKFREFWDEKAELRRFKDGSICEAVFWPTMTIQDKRKIAKEIIEFVLKSKLKIHNYSVLYDQFESILKLYKTPAIEEGNLKTVTIFDDLVKIVRDINLPLSISAVQGISESFCHTDAFPPIPTNYKCGGKITCEKDINIILRTKINLKVAPKYVAPVEGVIQMVHHSKWPNDLNAVKHLQAAFYIQISEQLKQQHKIKSNPKYEYIDILYKGLVFRLTIFHHKQIILLRKRTDEKGVTYFRDTEESVLMEQNFVILPKTIGALNGIHSQYPSFGPSTVLIKRWLNSQLIDESHISNIVISLLNASLYLNCAPFSQAVLPQVAFFRFLKMVAYHDWNLQTIIVNFNNEITKDKLDETESNFQQNRENYPSLFILTPYDLNSLLTQNIASKEILYRISTLAKECLTVIEKNLYFQDLLTVAAIFKPNLSGYNVVIHLQPFLNPRRYESIFSEFEKKILEEYEENQEDKIPVIKFNPVDYYLNELRTNYGTFALFFHDNYGGNVIAVLWKPITYEVQDFKVGNVEGRMLTKSGKLAVNIEALIEDFYILGEGLVKSIDKF